MQEKPQLRKIIAQLAPYHLFVVISEMYCHCTKFSEILSEKQGNTRLYSFLLENKNKFQKQLSIRVTTKNRVTVHCKRRHKKPGKIRDPVTGPGRSGIP